jgi:hypothetical protein
MMGRMRWEGMHRGRKWVRRGRKSSWGAEHWILAQEKKEE